MNFFLYRTIVTLQKKSNDKIYKEILPHKSAIMHHVPEGKPTNSPIFDRLAQGSLSITMASKRKQYIIETKYQAIIHVEKGI